MTDISTVNTFNDPPLLTKSTPPPERSNIGSGTDNIVKINVIVDYNIYNYDKHSKTVPIKVSFFNSYVIRSLCIHMCLHEFLIYNVELYKIIKNNWTILYFSVFLSVIFA